MTVYEIQKALEQHIERTETIKYGARKKALVDAELLKDIHDIINRQQAEIETQSQNFKMLVSDHRCLQQSFDNLKGLYQAEKEKIESAKSKSIYFAKELQKARAEIERLQNLTEKDFEQTAISTVKRHQKWIEYRAIKEFAERLTDRADLVKVNAFDSKYAISQDDIDNLIKEMVGDDK